ncbi:Z1 domain-containing protein [Bradyrhizobium barranii]|uniref:Z1 domain-containing protein n=1 Tax=Bradyrhizobium barranii TaxID=2992140 RepID=UPI0024B1732A|nr:Z1 domain-containing protein [Bradyrhizobium barranii]WFT96088.1 Z1 domain-containing protein [Bradyrhizobium barranii]
MTDIVEALALRARKILQVQKESGEVINRESIARIVDLDAQTFILMTRQAVTPEQKEATERLLWTIFVTEQGPALALQDKERPAPWYLGARRQPGPFMQRYVYKLEEDGWPVESIQQLQESTARILEVMDDPKREGSWDWRGLVVGDVQSGKTASYAGVVNRAADAGYRIIIVLAGMHKILRLQTQKRFDKDFLGYDTNPKTRLPNQPLRIIGVGNFNPQLTVDSLTMADPNGDFNQRMADQFNFSPVSQPCVFIVKKNAKVLENLNNWIARLPGPAKAAPVLVIDDESDQASVDTGDQPILEDGTFEQDYDPKRVNGEIRRLLMSFDRRVYVGYTATPFANILIHDERTAKDYGPDLFPSTFIVSLTPPDDYFGPVAVFGTNDDQDNPGLPLIRPFDQTAEDWIQDPHDKYLKPRFKKQDVIPPSLERAIDAFLLTCAARAARGQNREHNSMLVHVSRFVDVHGEVHRQVEKYLRETRAMISNGDRATMRRLKALWEADYLPTTEAVRTTVYGRNTIPLTWDQVAATLAESSDKIQVITANGKTKADIDYDAYQDVGYSVIAVGGDKLSRGLTLEGLSISYFLRVSRQYDSLLQMGRWFGYRRGFADLCRLYATPDMADWFRYVATAQKELRAQFFEMAQMDATPKDFGLKIAVHDILEVTATNKQRHAELRQSSYAGEGKVQTVMFKDRTTIERNAAITDDFLTGLGAGTDNPRRPGPGDTRADGTLWTGVAGREIAEYLKNLTFPPESLTVDGNRLSTFINDQLTMQPPELTDWTVFLATGSEKEIDIAGRRRKCVLRSPRVREGEQPPENRFIIGTTLSPLDQAIDLTDAEFEEALARTNRQRKTDNKLETNTPSGHYIRKVRGGRPQNGLLIIYPIDPDKAEVEPTERPVISVVVSFPDSEAADSRVYLINSVQQRQES